jgi:predicted membrane metal-binding protein
VSPHGLEFSTNLISRFFFSYLTPLLLKGYRVPLIESMVGPGTWLALTAGALLALVGLVGLVVPAWRARR